MLRNLKFFLISSYHAKPKRSMERMGLATCEWDMPLGFAYDGEYWLEAHWRSASL